MNHQYMTAAPTSALGRLRMAAILGTLTAIAPLSIDMYLPALSLIHI